MTIAKVKDNLPDCLSAADHSGPPEELLEQAFVEFTIRQRRQRPLAMHSGAEESEKLNGLLSLQKNRPTT